MEMPIPQPSQEFHIFPEGALEGLIDFLKDLLDFLQDVLDVLTHFKSFHKEFLFDRRPQGFDRFLKAFHTFPEESPEGFDGLP